MMDLKKPLLFLLLIFIHSAAQSQNRLVQDYTQLMEIPDVVAMEASATHLYILSKSEGLAVFRSYPDSLQWLYTSEGMQQRGDNIMADIRFAYLFGDSRRLTVLEPTSLLGVYSSTILPAKPKAASRVGNQLYIALGDAGLGFVSLDTPETVDSDVQMVEIPELNNAEILDLRTSITGRQMFVLTDNPALLIFNIRENTPELATHIRLGNQLSNIFIDGDEVWGATANGELYEINSSGLGNGVGNVPDGIADVLSWNDRLFVRGKSGKVWVTDERGRPELWKEDGNAGNFLMKSQNRLWISENDNITEVFIGTDAEERRNSLSGAFKLKPIPNQVLSYPEPLLLPLEMENEYEAGEVEFSYRSRAENAKIRENGFYWQPAVNQVGTHWFVIKASSADGKADSTRFMVEVRSFNAPPRFSPVRTSSIAVNETYEVTFHAIDPENPESNLIRYIGVDLPEGSELNERTGSFKWTPNNRQVGETSFRIIATDKSGAASSIDINLRVLDISRGN